MIKFFLAFTAVIVLVGANTVVLPEKEQLALLERADTYFDSENRENEKAIALYKEVLDREELADPIRLETMFRIANMYLFEMGPGLKAKPNVPAALEMYTAITKKFPEDNPTVFQSNGYMADCYLRLGDKKKAEEFYLHVRRLARSEDNAQYEPHLRAWQEGSLRNVVGMYASKDSVDKANLERLARENSDDSELLKAVQLALRSAVGREKNGTPSKVTQEHTAIQKQSPTPIRTTSKTPSDDSIRASKPGSRLPGEMVSPTLARQAISATYGIPICVEALNSDEKNGFEFYIQKNATLKYTLDTYVEKTGRQYEWKRIHDVLCTIQKTQPDGVNNLDTQVSLSLHSVSTWEAFKTLVKTINAKRSGTREIHLAPDGPGVFKRPAKALLEERTISLEIQDVPAREAACAIVAAAPIEVNFNYVSAK